MIHPLLSCINGLKLHECKPSRRTCACNRVNIIQLLNKTWTMQSTATDSVHPQRNPSQYGCQTMHVRPMKNKHNPHITYHQILRLKNEKPLSQVAHTRNQHLVSNITVSGNLFPTNSHYFSDVSLKSSAGVYVFGIFVPTYYAMERNAWHLNVKTHNSFITWLLIFDNSNFPNRSVRHHQFSTDLKV